MFYVVRWIKGGEIVASQGFADLAEAKAHAEERLPINRMYGVTAVEVADFEGATYRRIEVEASEAESSGDQSPAPPTERRSRLRSLLRLVRGSRLPALLMVVGGLSLVSADL